MHMYKLHVLFFPVSGIISLRRMAYQACWSSTRRGVRMSALLILLATLFIFVTFVTFETERKVLDQLKSVDTNHLSGE